MCMWRKKKTGRSIVVATRTLKTYFKGLNHVWKVKCFESGQVIRAVRKMASLACFLKTNNLLTHFRTVLNFKFEERWKWGQLGRYKRCSSQLASQCTVMAPEPVHLTDSRYRWLYLLREKHCCSLLNPFFFLSGDLNVATVIIEVRVALITDCPTATGRRIGFVSDWSSQHGDLQRDIGTLERSWLITPQW